MRVSRTFALEQLDQEYPSGRETRIAILGGGVGGDRKDGARVRVALGFERPDPARCSSPSMPGISRSSARDRKACPPGAASEDTTATAPLGLSVGDGRASPGPCERGLVSLPLATGWKGRRCDALAQALPPARSRPPDRRPASAKARRERDDAHPLDLMASKTTSSDAGVGAHHGVTSAIPREIAAADARERRAGRHASA